MKTGNTHSRTALLLMDFCSSPVSRLPADKGKRVIARAVSARAAARAAGVKIIYIVPHYRPGRPELANRSPVERQPAENFVVPDPATSIHPDLRPEDGDWVVKKIRYSPFWNTDLELLLRANDIDTLVLSGIATSGVVLSGLRDADDRAYKLYVLSDCCEDFDDETHRLLIEKLFPKQAQVINSTEWMALLK